MESNPDKETQGNCFQIDTVWSEAEENWVVKEEIVSDVELDCNPSTTENSSDVDHNSSTSKMTGEEENHNHNYNNELLNSWQVFKKKIRNKSQTTSTEDCDLKASCLHDTKNFKIVKRRLRCGDCRSMVCPECCKIMASSLQNHFLGSNVTKSCSYSCKVCSIPFNSLCALQAHIRIHTMDTPYVCPDCGLIYNNIYFLILHLINKCYHVYKIIRYKCKSCPGVYFTFDTFVQHIQQFHMENVIRCFYCSSLFSNSDEFNSHTEKVHKKQKAQYLNYFKCSMCSDMVIPKFMYQKHITQHYENSESYEVNYQCLCNEVYSLIGAFRAHIQHCKDKGALPPLWSFLQRNLKNQEKSPNEKYQANDVSLSKYSNGNADAQLKKLNLIRPFDESGANNGNVKNCESFKNNCVKLDENMSNHQGNKNSDNGENLKSVKEEPASSESFSTNKPDSSEVDPLNKQNRKECLDKTDNFESETPVSQTEKEGHRETVIGNTTFEIKEKNNQIVEGTETDKNDKETEQVDADSSKIFYDHIPCDHLGYVIKTQCPDSVTKDGSSGEPIVLEKVFVPQKYHVVTELNERTGLMMTKKIPIEHVEVEEIKEDGDVKPDDIGEGKESGNPVVSSPQISPKLYGVEKTKCKFGNSLFTCPFCVVLFPKHSATFQQFRLHLESYHPDAALNITVNREQNDKTPPKDPLSDFITPKSSELGKNKDYGVPSDGSNKPGEDVPSCQNINKATKEPEDCLQNNSEKDHCLEDGENALTNSEISSNSRIHSGACEERVLDEDGGENLTEENNRVHKRFNEGSENDCCWTMELPLEDKNYLEEGSTGKVTADTHSEANKQNKEVECLAIIEPSKSNTVYQVDTDDIKEDKEQKSENYNGDEALQEEERGASCCSVSVIGETTIQESEEQTGEKETEKNLQELANNNSLKVPSDFEDECDTSNHSNWSAGSVEYIRARDSKDSPGESKGEEKERSRRESEVWSEFYESLMLAEKLKKKKSQLHLDDTKKSVVSDYSAKRIVKKPKRYRESSESGDSIGGNDNSDSDAEFLPSNDFIDSINWQERKEKSGTDGGIIDDQLLKKQKLLKKLENADDSFLDYLCDLVNKKEKYFELYKKHYTLRSNSYGQDLRSYRKKVLNGIKQRGRPHKVLKYQELMKKKDPIQPAGNKNVSGQLTPKKETTGETKPGERKRGRPRKIVESAKLKERRRSDKEVDFIEKNFEREENDLSPSKRKRKLSSKLQYYKKINLSDEKEDFSSGQVITNKPLDSSKKFSCAVCKEVFPDFAELREHVLVHRMEENTYQCMECGECFVVRPSLEKHLHAFHKIKNTDKYIKDNQCCNVKKEAAEVESEPLKENQCKVCKDKFERAIDLTKHFRIHGMAFLKEFKKDGKAK